MNSTEIYYKITTGLNKLSSNDYQNIEKWVIQQEYHKAKLNLIREQINGVNIKREGQESSIFKITDLQILLKTDILSGENKKVYFESQSIPTDFLYFSRLTPTILSSECDIPFTIQSISIEDTNVDEYLNDDLKAPSLKFEQCFHTFGSNKIKVYHNDEFSVKECILSYYRKPLLLQFQGAIQFNGSTGKQMDEEFKDDVTELFVEKTISNIASNIESINRKQIADQSLQQDI
jgi:hypothetical protein